MLLIDLQEAYRPVLHAWDRVTAASRLLLRGAQLLGVPVVVTEQYPRGVGATAAEVAAALPPAAAVIQKMTMSCYESSQLRRHLEALACRQIVVMGIEAHACVNQSVHDLLAAGYQVHVVRDAISSRRATDVDPAWHKMLVAGALATSSEQALLELVRTADAPEFKALQRLLKDVPA